MDYVQNAAFEILKMPKSNTNGSWPNLKSTFFDFERIHLKIFFVNGSKVQVKSCLKCDNIFIRRRIRLIFLIVFYCKELQIFSWNQSSFHEFFEHTLLLYVQTCKAYRSSFPVRKGGCYMKYNVWQKLRESNIFTNEITTQNSMHQWNWFYIKNL